MTRSVELVASGHRHRTTIDPPAAVLAWEGRFACRNAAARKHGHRLTLGSARAARKLRSGRRPRTRLISFSISSAFLATDTETTRPSVDLAKSPAFQPPGDHVLDCIEHLIPGSTECLSRLFPGRATRPARQKQHISFGQRAFAIAPRNLLDHDRGAATAIHAPHGIQKEDEKAPPRNELEATLRELDRTRGRADGSASRRRPNPGAGAPTLRCSSCRHRSGRAGRQNPENDGSGLRSRSVPWRGRERRRNLYDRRSSS